MTRLVPRQLPGRADATNAPRAGCALVMVRRRRRRSGPAVPGQASRARVAEGCVGHRKGVGRRPGTSGMASWPAAKTNRLRLADHGQAAAVGHPPPNGPSSTSEPGRECMAWRDPSPDTLAANKGHGTPSGLPPRGTSASETRASVIIRRADQVGSAPRRRRRTPRRPTSACCTSRHEGPPQAAPVHVREPPQSLRRQTPRAPLLRLRVRRGLGRAPRCCGGGAPLWSRHAPRLRSRLFSSSAEAGSPPNPPVDAGHPRPTRWSSQRRPPGQSPTALFVRAPCFAWLAN